MKLSTFRKCGFRRVAAISPEVKIADVDFNVSKIKEILSSGFLTNTSVIVFPELCITGYTCADLFLNSTLISGAEHGISKLCDSLQKICLKENISYRCGTPDPLLFIGAPIRVNANLYNCAIAIHKGKILGIVPKTYIPNYGEFYECRWFESAAGLGNVTIDYAGQSSIPFGTHLLFRHDSMTIGAEICEDLWTPDPPSSSLSMAGADVIVNLSASNAVLGKQRYRRELILQQSARCRCAYIYASAGLGESSTDLAFPGYAAVAENGSMLNEALSFPTDESDIPHVIDLKCAIADIDPQRLKSERIRFNTFTTTHNSDLLRTFTIIPSEFEGHQNIYDSNAYAIDNIPESITGSNESEFPERHESIVDIDPEISPINNSLNPAPFVPSDATHRNENCTEIINIQCHGLLQRLRSIGYPKMIIGVSGGLDSTLALLIAVRTAKLAGMSISDVIGITMPGLATTNRTHSNAWKLMTLLGCTTVEIPIGAAVAQHFKDISQNPEIFDATFENSQARERTQILMDYANKTGGIVIGTGDLSELALGWCTYNGDHMSMYAVNTSVPKTLVKYLVEWFALKEKNVDIKTVLLDIIDTPISPELVPARQGSDEIEQKTEDLVGPYELHDFFLFHTLRNGFDPWKIYSIASEAFKDKYDKPTILRWLKTFHRRFFNQQFKRSCLPDGPKVGSVCLSPRGDWRMPSDASARLWQSILEEIEKDFEN